MVIKSFSGRANRNSVIIRDQKSKLGGEYGAIVAKVGSGAVWTGGATHNRLPTVEKFISRGCMMNS